MLQPYTQFCYVVHDMEKHVHKWVKLGAGPFYTLDETILPAVRDYRGKPAKDLSISARGFFGTSQIEIVQPLDNEPSIFREVLDTKGEVLHHLQPRCRPIDSAEFDRESARYLKAGLKLATHFTAEGFGRVAFFDGLEQHGFFLELLERNEAGFQFSIDMYNAHLNWDGKNPIRPFVF